MLEFAMRYPIGWETIKFKNIPGLRNKLPEIGKNVIRIFGDIPTGITLESIINKANIDLDNFNSIEIEISYLGNQCLLIAKNNDEKREYKFSIQIDDLVTVVETRFHDQLTDCIK